MTVEAGGAKQISLPETDGPWSWRAFGDRETAWRFFHRLQEGDPVPRRLDEPHLAPDGTFVPPGTWVVLYRPIIGGRSAPRTPAGASRASP